MSCCATAAYQWALQSPITRRKSVKFENSFTGLGINSDLVLVLISSARLTLDCDCCWTVADAVTVAAADDGRDDEYGDDDDDGMNVEDHRQLIKTNKMRSLHKSYLNTDKQWGLIRQWVRWMAVLM